MRRVLDALYKASGAMAAVFLAAICGIVLLQVGANIIDALAHWTTGQAIGLVIPSYAEFAGFFLAAASFLALAYTLRAGALIRVSLIIQFLGRGPRRVFELWCAGAGAALSGYFAYYTILLVLESLEYGDVSPGMVPVPLWIPQLPMAIGLAVLTIAFIDEVAAILSGRNPAYMLNETDAEG